jgi:hypothetical protein
MTNAMTPARYVQSLFGLDGKLAVVTSQPGHRPRDLARGWMAR